MIINESTVDGLGDFIHHRRTAMGLSIQALAREAYVSDRTIELLEDSRQIPRLTTLMLIGQVLGLEIEIREVSK